MDSSDTAFHQIAQALQSNRPDRALAIIENNVGLTDSHPILLYAQAIALLQTGQKHKCITTLKTLTKILPGHEPGRRLLYGLTGVSHEVEDENIAGLAAKAKDWMTRSWAHFEAGRPIRALVCIDKAASLGVYVPRLHYLKGKILAILGRTPEAVEELELESVLNHSDSDVLKTLHDLRKEISNQDHSRNSNSLPKLRLVSQPPKYAPPPQIDLIYAPSTSPSELLMTTALRY